MLNNDDVDDDQDADEDDSPRQKPHVVLSTERPNYSLLDSIPGISRYEVLADLTL